MSVAHTVTLKLPIQLYNRFRRRAEKTQRSIEIEVLEAVATAATAEDDLPSDLTQMLAALSAVGDPALWQAARQHFASEDVTRLEQLHLKRQREGLTPAETESAETLIRQYERAMLARAQAAVLLRQRGYDISTLLNEPA